MKLLFLAVLFFPFVAQAFSLTWPVRCTLGKDCFVQNYVDHDATAGWSDFSCGALSYNAHDGTDIRLKNLQAMRVGAGLRRGVAPPRRRLSATPAPIEGSACEVFSLQWWSAYADQGGARPANPEK